MNKLFKISVKENKKLTNNHYLITLHPLKKMVKPKPGQFFMLSAGTAQAGTYSGMDPLLKRPFSLHRRRGRDFQLLYRTVGRATGILKEKKPGDILEIIGPLGNGFPAPGQKTRKILIAGGLGIAPVFALAETILKSSRGKTGKDLICFLGAKTRKELLCVDKLRSIGIRPIISTDDGTVGQKGLVTDKLKDFLSGHPLPVTGYCLYACGPKPMLKELSSLADKFGLRGYMALEENMACGIGACLSCVVKTRQGLKRVCKEGPVFPMEEIIW